VIFIKIVFATLLSFLICFYVIPLLIVLAHRIRFVDRPDGIIKNHTTPIPYMGGIAVYSGFLCGIALTLPFDYHIFLLVVGTTLLLLLGLLDDGVALQPYQKFFGQSLVALCFLKAGFYLKHHFFYNVWHLPLSFLWILSLINALNLVDVMDGLAALIALCAATILFGIGVYLQNYLIVIVIGAFIGSIAAFFWYNKPPASIYLGDAGSLFIGGFLGVIPFFFDWGTYNFYGFLTPIIIMGIPLLELGSLILIRTYKGIPFYKGSPDHFSHYLLAKGWSKRQVLGFVAICYSFIALMSFLFMVGKVSILCTVTCGCIFLIVWIVLIFAKS
jgi:UDP-GlcNAc:undecaprenyl-phosphate GlcNAc-1-phosphate transferase